MWEYIHVKLQIAVNDDTNGFKMIQFDQTVSESQLTLGHQAFTMEDKGKDHIMKQRI